MSAETGGSVARVVRVFRAEVRPGMEDQFRQFFVQEALPDVRARKGLLSAVVGLPASNTPHSFLMISTWSSLDALKEFAGDAWPEAVIDPREQHLLESTTVSHYLALDE
jgi:quinol monooxygenase YgiN